jgi:hypothetical protein
MSGFAESGPPRVVNGLIECVMLPELLAQQFSGKYLGVIARLEHDRPWSALVVSDVELVSTNGICALDDDFDVLANGEIVSRMLKPVMWTFIMLHREGRRPTHGYAATREGAISLRAGGGWPNYLRLAGMAEGNELLWTIEVRRLGLMFAPWVRATVTTATTMIRSEGIPLIGASYGLF